MASNSRRSKGSERLYDIEEEITQLKEIKNIQDELHILSMLLENQITVLDQAKQILQSADDLHDPRAHFRLRRQSTWKHGYTSSQNLPERHFSRLKFMVEEQEKRRKGPDVQADQANKNVSELDHISQGHC